MLLLTVALMFVMGAPSFDCLGNSEQIPGGSNHPARLWFLGTLDGRSYYGEMGQELTWKDAKAYCEEEGLHLVSLVHKNQTDFLKEKHFNNIGSHYFWTAARDDHAINGLVWDNTDNKPNMDIGLKWESDLGVRDYSMCGAIHGVRNGELHLHGFPCTEKAYILCQS